MHRSPLRLLVWTTVCAAALGACAEEAAPPAGSGSADSAAGVDSAGGEATVTDAAGFETAAADAVVSADATAGVTDAALDPGPAADAAAEVVADSAPDSAPDAAAAPDNTPDSAPDLPPDTATAPDTAVDAGADAAADTGAGPDSAPDTAADAASDPGAAPDSAAEVATDAAPDFGAAPDTALDAASAPDGGSDGSADAGSPADTAPTCKPTTPPTEACDGVDNDCDGKTDDKPCDDGNLCTTDNCAGVSGCQFSSAAPCDDGNACTDDSCDTKTGCKNAPNTSVCDDLNACTTELCSAGACKATAKVCDDGDVCTSDGCDPGSGNCTASQPKGCDDNNPCSDDSCDKAKGCQNNANAAPCDDGSACTTPDGCKDKACMAGAAVVCDDKNPCTTDSCDKVKGCTAANNTAPCDDGDPCTSEVCAAGACKATAKVCDDKDACTTDSCDGQSGACVATAVPNCKACTSNANCSDGNDCTTDTCVSAKCQNAPIANCVGPTDYSVTAVTVVTPKVGLAGTVKWEVAMANPGKKPTSATATAYLSSDDAVSTDDLKLHVDNGATGPISVAATAPTKTIAYSAALATAVQDAKHKFLCVQITWLTGTDPTPANNVKCAPIEMLMPDYEVVAIKPSKDTWFWNWGPYPVTVTYKNVGNGAPIAGLEALVKPSLSGDNQAGAGDLGLGVVGGTPNTGLLAAGASKDVTLNLDLTGNKGSIIANHLCVQLQPGNPLKELNTANNALCVPLKVVTVAEVALAAIAGPNASPPTQPPGFLNSGAWSSAGQYGSTPACYLSNLANIGEVAFANFAVRCWLQTGAPGSANPSKIWEVKATSDKSIPTASTLSVPFQVPNAVVTGLPDGTVKMGAAVGGVPQPMALTMCMAFNEDGAVLEKSLTNNQTCFGVTLSAIDLGWLEPTGPVGPTPSTIAKGTSAQVKKTNLKNFGSAGSKGGTSPATYVRLALSKDNLFSSDDVVLWSSVPLPALPAGQGATISQMGAADSPVGFTIPAATAAGSYFLVFKIDATDVQVEANEGNNGWSYPITVN